MEENPTSPSPALPERAEPCLRCADLSSSVEPDTRTPELQLWSPPYLSPDEDERPPGEGAEHSVQLAPRCPDSEVAAEEEEDENALSSDLPAVEEAPKQLHELGHVQRADVDRLGPGQDLSALPGSGELVCEGLQLSSGLAPTRVQGGRRRRPRPRQSKAELVVVLEEGVQTGIPERKHRIGAV